ncbi:hypothetical protein ACFQRK_20590 [Parapedobacter sp. GCM10030251]|uniref:hypothetical protein n=1 Tax=Parapedobacter sp. GCM10030251 TaxID=3273419 RepID=UPI0036235CCF
MKKVMLVLVVAAMTPSIWGCSKSNHASVVKPVISLRTLAGWCAINDSLSVDKNNMRYIAYERCTDEIRYNKEVATTEADYQALLQILRTGDFTQLDIQEGGLAYDGYAYIITVRDHAWEHTISLENENSEAAQQQNALAVRLLRKLKDIRDRLSEANANE